MKDTARPEVAIMGAGNRHELVVQLLLETGQPKIDSMDVFGQTSLSHAAGNGHEAAVKLLILAKVVIV